MILPRIIAYIIDIIFLYYIYNFITLSFNDYFNLLFLIIYIIYFTLFDSKIGNGHTIGKKITSINVKNLSDKNLNIKDSFIRTILMSTPLFLVYLKSDFLNVSFYDINILYLLFSLITIGLPIGNLIFIFLNKQEHRGFHEIISNSIVTNGYTYSLRPPNYWILIFLFPVIFGSTFIFSKFFKVVNENNTMVDASILSNIANNYPSIESVGVKSNDEIKLRLKITPEKFKNNLKLFMKDVKKEKFKSLDIKNCTIILEYVFKSETIGVITSRKIDDKKIFCKEYN